MGKNKSLNLLVFLTLTILCYFGQTMLVIDRIESAPLTKKAFLELMQKKVESGDARAQFNLGVLYYDGEGVPQNYSEAAKWYRKAAEQGFARAQFNLGLMYKNGEGVSQDYKEAVKWYRKAAEQGDARAQNNLGVFYEYGVGVSQNYKTAYIWYSLSAANKKLDISNEVARRRDEVEKKLSPVQLEQAQEIVRDWKPKNER